MTPAYRLRPIAAGDRQEWEKLWQGYNAFYGREGDTALDEHITDSTWQRLFDRAEPMSAFVVQDGDSLAGLVHYIYHRSTILIGPTCYLQDLFVGADQRGKGIARALIEAVAAQARKDGAERLYWLTHESNATARTLYDKLAEHAGFIVYRKPL